MHTSTGGKNKPLALSLLASERPRNVGWLQAAGLLFGDWGTSRLYVLGLALFFAGRSSFWLILAMSFLILAVGWAYTQICRIYPDGGGVYTAAKKTSKLLAVVGALLLFADYTVTASLSSLDAFHYFGLPLHKQVDAEQKAADRVVDTPGIGAPKAVAKENVIDTDPTVDAGDKLNVHRKQEASAKEKLLAWDSPGLWAIVAVAGIGIFNLMGPKHTGGFAIAAAVGMVFITLLITAFALPQIAWHNLPHQLGTLQHDPQSIWIAFVSIVLALSGVEAIANLTGVMKRPVPLTANKAIWVVAGEVAVFNVLLAVAMLAIPVLNRDAHLEDMLAYMTGHYVGRIGEYAVRFLGGTLLLSAANTALTDMISVQYLMARDGELPPFFVKLNRFGVPWVAAVLAASVPVLVLLISHDLDRLASLYAIGVIGAVAINVTLCAIHPRLRKAWRKVPMMMLGVILLAIWITLAFVKHEALIFVCVVMTIGLVARALNKWWMRRRGPRPSLLRQAVMAQLTETPVGLRKVLLGTYGSDKLGAAALRQAKQDGCALVVCFIRSVNLSFKYNEQRLTIDTDLGALRTFARILDLGHDMGVTVLPVYDTGADAAELMAETAAMMNCEKVLIGSSRQGAFYHLIKGHFQERLESILPDDIKVQVLSPDEVPAAPALAGH